MSYEDQRMQLSKAIGVNSQFSLKVDYVRDESRVVIRREYQNIIYSFNAILSYLETRKINTSLTENLTEFNVIGSNRSIWIYMSSNQENQLLFELDHLKLMLIMQYSRTETR